MLRRKLLFFLILFILIPVFSRSSAEDYTVHASEAVSAAETLVDMFHKSDLRPYLSSVELGDFMVIRDKGRIMAFIFHLQPKGCLVLSAHKLMNPIQFFSLTSDFNPESDGYEKIMINRIENKWKQLDNNGSFDNAMFINRKCWDFWIHGINHDLNAYVDEDFLTQINQKKHDRIEAGKYLGLDSTCVTSLDDFENQIIAYIRYLHEKFDNERKLYTVLNSEGRILSMNADLKLINSSTYLQEDYFGDAVFTGAAVNEGSGGAVFSKINVEFFDKNDNLIGRDYSYLRGGTNTKLEVSGIFTNALRPSEKGYFKVWSNYAYKNVDHVRVSFDWDEYSFTKAKADLRFDGSPNFTRDYFGDLYITGNIKNRSENYVSYFTKVHFAIKNDAGRVVDVDFTYVNGDSYDTGTVTTDTAVYPGQSWPFELYTLTEYRLFSSYDSFFEWNEECIGLEEYTLTIRSGAGGTTKPSPGKYSHEEGSDIKVRAVPHDSHRFKNWSGDASGGKNPVTITMNADKLIKAHFVRQYTLSITAGAGGTTEPVPGHYKYDEGKEVFIKAIPHDYYIFRDWTGGISSNMNPLKVTVDSDISVKANFQQIYNPLYLSGEKILNRSLFQAEYIVVLKWEANPANQSLAIAGYRVYQVDNGWHLLKETGPDGREYQHRHVKQDQEYQYAVVAVHENGTEGQPVYVTVS
ncbi:MAG: hypothetical protein R6V02_11490 [Candidatus Aminicenantes bacterium]